MKQDLDQRLVGNSADVSISRVPASRPAAVAALNNTFSGNTGNTSGMRNEKQELKEMIEQLSRETDARIRGLARRTQTPRTEQPRERTRDGRPVCFHCGRAGHLQTSCPEKRNVQPQRQQRQSSYPPNSNYNQSRDSYRNYSQPSRREQRLAALDEGSYDGGFIAQLQQSSDQEVLVSSAVETQRRVSEEPEVSPRERPDTLS